jgi:5-methylcytosine-specific restriction endonuclease McrA
MPNIPKNNRSTLAVKARSRYLEQKANAFKGMDRSNSKIYKSKQWQKVRKLVLHRDPICVMCKASNRYVTANTIDHIIPINKGGLIYSLDNLQSLCSSCHNSKSASDRT